MAETHRTKSENYLRFSSKITSNYSDPTVMVQSDLCPSQDFNQDSVLDGEIEN